MKNATSLKPGQPVCCFGVVPVDVYERRLEAIIERQFAGDSMEADAARIAIGEALRTEADDLMKAFQGDAGMQAQLFQGHEAMQATQALVPWVALYLVTPSLVFWLKRIGGDVLVPCRPSDISHLTENRVETAYQPLHSFIISRQPELSNMRLGGRLWSFNLTAGCDRRRVA